MKMSQLYLATLREVPAEAEIASHQLMLRAGLIHKVAMGIYSYMPLGWRTIKKIMEIIRQEMDAKGGQELCMPIVQPAELWQDVYKRQACRSHLRAHLYESRLYRLFANSSFYFSFGSTRGSVGE